MPSNNQGMNLFGAPPKETSAFGEKPASQPSLFANTKPTSNLFGQPSNTTSTASSNLFGAPSSAFGAPSQASSGLFGSNQPSTTSAFGAAKTTGGMFGAKPTESSGTTMFGAKGPAAAPAGGLFNANSGPGLFDTKPQPSLTGTGGTLFGANAAQPAGTGTLFSTKPTQPAASGPSFFNTKPAAPPTLNAPAKESATSDLFKTGTMFDAPKATTTSDLFATKPPVLNAPEKPQQSKPQQFTTVEDDVEDFFMGAANTFANNGHGYGDDDAPYELDDDLLGETNFRVSRRYHVPGKEPADEKDSMPLEIPDSEQFLQANPKPFILAMKRLTDELLGKDDDADDGDATPTRALRRRTQTGQMKPVGERFHKAFQRAAASSENDDLKEAYAVSVLLVPLYDSLGGTTHQEHRARQVFTEWARERNSLNEEEIQDLFDYEPSPASSKSIWRMINQLAIHGRMQDLEELLSKCDWSRTLNPSTAANYRKDEVQLIRTAFSHLARLIPQAPIGSNEPAKWRVWRGMVINYSEEIKAMAHPPTAQEMAIDEAEFFLKKQRGGARAGVAPRRPIPKHGEESTTPLPRNIEQALLRLARILEGDVSAVYDYVDDWEGALVYKLTWSRYKDPSDVETDPDMSLAASRRFNQSIRRPLNATLKRQQPKPPIWRLKQYFEEVTQQIPINSSDTAQLVLSKVVTGNWKGALDIMRKAWGIVSIVAFLVEYSKVHNWPGANDPFLKENNTFINRFGREELELLQGSKPEKISWADRILAEYAVGLMGVGDIDGAAEGWELGMDVIDRIGNSDWAQELRSKLVVQLPLSSPHKVDSILHFCISHDLRSEAKLIAEAFANTAPLPSPGLRLKYLSVAHIRPRLHSLIQTYLARSLLAGQSFPIDDELDADFDALLRSPPDDDLLRFELAGYATVRMYFTAREEGEDRVAARALAALIRSAGEQISEDKVEDVHASVDWWASYVLLGEALDLIGNKEQFFELQDLFDMLRVLESLSHLPQAALEPARQLYDMAIFNANINYPATKEESWEGVKSELFKLGSVRNLRNGWRKRRFTIKEMVQCLRVGIAREVGRGWLEEEY
ncbi:hypothetical protein BJ508DRAFT_414650 [Ascobolus immersus RN42]|uniref:Nuclear pore complex protein Nup85 n=1 Tax=Ascobolus immersus RN42 TaxID=1160509 RepID=A0A3N4I7S9_ASCIM|nr:hypothetical protein BJ508DRAFT_414650 [Ascobolus immersus RN42]